MAIQLFPLEQVVSLSDQFRRQATLRRILAVPSVSVPSEVNDILKPSYADCKKIILNEAKLLSFDLRLLRTANEQD